MHDSAPPYGSACIISVHGCCEVWWLSETIVCYRCRGRSDERWTPLTPLMCHPCGTLKMTHECVALGQSQYVMSWYGGDTDERLRDESLDSRGGWVKKKALLSILERRKGRGSGCEDQVCNSCWTVQRQDHHRSIEIARIFCRC